MGSTRLEPGVLDLDDATIAHDRMEATILTGWIYNHLLPHTEKVNLAHPLTLRVIAAATKKNDKIDADEIAECLRCDFGVSYALDGDP